jgi:uncharacterized delta-60 repeat protein
MICLAAVLLPGLAVYRLGAAQVEAPNSLTPNGSLVTLEVALAPAAADILVEPVTITQTLTVSETGISTFTVHNLGDAWLSYTISQTAPADWLAAAPAAGEVISGEEQVIETTMSAAGLEPGTYTATLVVENRCDIFSDAFPVTVVPYPYRTYLPMVITYSFAPSTGVLDPSFDEDGILISNLPLERETARAIAMQADGKLVIAGLWTSLFEGNGGFVARYNPDGSLDTSFSEDGWVIYPALPGHGIGFYDLVIQEDGKILAFGFETAESYYHRMFLLVRFNPDGSLDESFGQSGAVTTDFPGYSTSPAQVLLQPDGKIVVVGISEDDDYSQDTASLARYNPDGSLDASFGVDGKLQIVYSDYDTSGKAIAYQADGKLVVAGSFLLARLNPDGSLDASFGAGGYVTPGDSIADILVQPDGKIVAGGGSFYVNPPNRGSYFMLARYNPDGSLDASFGEGGIVITDVNNHDEFTAIERQADGKIVAAGETSWYGYTSLILGPDPNMKGFALARYNLDGSLDTGFGEAGLVIIDITPNADENVYDMLLQPDGRIVVVGSPVIVVVRYK